MTTFDAMVAEFRQKNAADERNAAHEVMQQIALAGLSRGGFFEKAAFYGGTCLRLLHGMRRFSEDMDFSLLKPDLGFRFEDYFPAVVEEFRLAASRPPSRARSSRSRRTYTTSASPRRSVSRSRSKSISTRRRSSLRKCAC